MPQTGVPARAAHIKHPAGHGVIKKLGRIREHRHLRNLALIGFMGAGKSSVGCAVASGVKPSKSVLDWF